MKPLLDQIRIASPCQVSWDEMQGDDRQRHCSHCQLHVFNLSDMTRPEAEQFVRSSEGRTCIRFFQRADGTMITRDCPVGLRAARLRVARMLAGAATIMGGLVFGGLAGRVLAASGNISEHPRVAQVLEWLHLQTVPPPQVMGAMEVPPGIMVLPPGSNCVMGDMIAPPDSTSIEAPPNGESPSIE